MSGLRHPKRAACVFSILFAALPALLVVSQPAPHPPFQYMVAGASATAGGLLAGFVLFAIGHR